MLSLSCPSPGSTHSLNITATGKPSQALWPDSLWQVAYSPCPTPGVKHTTPRVSASGRGKPVFCPEQRAACYGHSGPGAADAPTLEHVSGILSRALPACHSAASTASVSCSWMCGHSKVPGGLRRCSRITASTKRPSHLCSCTAPCSPLGTTSLYRSDGELRSSRTLSVPSTAVCSAGPAQGRASCPRSVSVHRPHQTREPGKTPKPGSCHSLGGAR